MKINRSHETCLRSLYNEKQLLFNELLEKYGSVLIHEGNLHVLVIKMYKISLLTPLMEDIFPRNKISYILIQNFQFPRPRINTVYHWTKTILDLGRKIWDLVPSNLKKICDLDKLKKN